MEPLYVKRNEVYVPVGQIDPGVISPPPPPPVDLGMIVNPGDDIQEAVDASTEGGTITVRHGLYPPFLVRDGLHGLTIQKYPGEAAPTISALSDPRLEWRVTDPGVYEARYEGFPGRRWHWSRNSKVDLFHKQAACPDQFVYQYSDRYEILRPVFERKALEPGTFFTDGEPDRPERVFVMLPAGAGDIRMLRLSASPYLCRLEDGARAEAVTLRGLGWAYCGSTHKTGSVHLDTHWTLDGGKVAFGAGCGVILSGVHPVIRSATIAENGHCSFYSSVCSDPLIEGVHTVRNGTRGANAQYEIGGKLTNATGVVIRGLESDEEARPVWLDISCHDPLVEDVVLRRPIGAGIQIEHWSSRGIIRRFAIHDVQPYDPGDGRVRRFGVQVQSGIFDATFEDGYIGGADIGFFYKKHEGRAGSGRNTATRFRYENCHRNSVIETMTDDQIRAAIAKGARPAELALWHQPDIFDATV